MTLNGVIALTVAGDWNLQEWKMTDHLKTGGGICRTGKWRTKSQGWNLQDWKMTDKVAGVEFAGLENDGLENEGLENDGLENDW